MSKERLEEIQNEVNYAYRRDGSISTKAVTMPIEHYEHLYEQAERVQELELGSKDASFAISMLEAENKHYREAIKDAGNELFLRIATDEDTVIKYALEILNKALEDENE